jgi:hypothetical protein
MLPQDAFSSISRAEIPANHNGLRRVLTFACPLRQQGEMIRQPSMPLPRGLGQRFPR